MDFLLFQALSGKLLPRSHPETLLGLRRLLAVRDFAVFVVRIAEDTASSYGFVSARHKPSRLGRRVLG